MIFECKLNDKEGEVLMLKIHPKIILLISLMLVFLTGRFELGRVGRDLSLNLEVRYIFFAITIACMLFISKNKIYKSGKKLEIFSFLSILFFSLLIFSIIYSNNIQIAKDKFNIVLFVLALFLVTLHTVKLFDKEKILYIVALFFIIIGMVYIALISQSILAGRARGSIGIGGPNVTTRILFFSLISGLYMYKSRQIVLYLIFSALMFIGIVVVGSRGGMVAAFICLAIMLFIEICKFKLIRIKGFFSMKKIIGALSVIYIFSLFSEYIGRVFESRFMNLLVNKVHYAGRDVLYERSMQLIVEKPIFGYGINGYTVMTGGNYPHNIFLEIMLDIGVTGMIIFVPMIIFGILCTLWSFEKDYFFFSLAPLYMIIVNQFSGDLYDFRFFFFWSILVLNCLDLDRNVIKEKIVYQKKLFS